MRRAGFALAALIVIGTGVAAQRRYFGEGGFPPVFPPASGIPTSGLVMCRLMYNSVRAETMGIGWRTDYPGAETNYMIRASELTKTHINFDGAQDPTNYVVRMTDEAMFQCPFMLASDVGTIGINQQEAEQLRRYLLKGGFLWVDDFWGNEAWAQWSREIAKALPPNEYPIEDIAPGDPLFKALFEIDKVPQITNIQFWRGVGGETTSERGLDSAEAHIRAIRDTHGRIVVLMTHNTDVADSWEREGEDPAFFYQFSPNGYALAMNVLVHVLSH
jgi:hypothetical protein